MGANKIEVYEGNDIAVITTVSGITSLAGYTSTLTVKATKESSTALFTNTPGTINGLNITHNITNVENDMDHGQYYFEITIDNGTYKYTVVQDYYVILESIVYVDAS